MQEILEAIKNKHLTVEEGISLLMQFTIGLNENNLRSIIKMLALNAISVEKAFSMLSSFSLNAQNNNLSEIKAHKEALNKSGDRIRRAARPLEKNEYEEILKLCQTGFKYVSEDTEKTFRPNTQLAMTFLLQANLGLRISDVLKLKPSTFKNDKLEIIEKKTGKLQYRDINYKLKNLIYEYAVEKSIKSDEHLIKLGRAAIHKQLQIISDYLKITNVSSHSFRKFFAMTIYKESGGDIELVKELLNHTSLATTQKYIKLSQAEINKASASVDLIVPWIN